MIEDHTVSFIVVTFSAISLLPCLTHKIALTCTISIGILGYMNATKVTPKLTKVIFFLQFVQLYIVARVLDSSVTAYFLWEC